MILGIGNPLRGDDGLGWIAAERVAEEMGGVCDVVAVHQLTPDLAPCLAAARLAILIDASVEGRPGDMRVRQVTLERPHPLTPSPFIVNGEGETWPGNDMNPQASVLVTHHYAPDALAALAEALYGACPPLFTVTVTGACFDLCECLSSIVAQQMPAIIATMRQLCEMS